jgi:hypothetical protein
MKHAKFAASGVKAPSSNSILGKKIGSSSTTGECYWKTGERFFAARYWKPRQEAHYQAPDNLYKAVAAPAGRANTKATNDATPRQSRVCASVLRAANRPYTNTRLQHNTFPTLASPALLSSTSGTAQPL